ncbi:MAG: cache domain-containing protein [Oligoflexia bacterium]|nr:cache domain-containing protein [Oligoflexia bacterium]
MTKLFSIFFITLFFSNLFLLKITTVIAEDTTATATTTTAPKFDEKELCSNQNEEIASAKSAVEISCNWIANLELGNKDDANSALGKIFRHRFCGDNYVYVVKYEENLTVTSHSNEKPLIIHPTKPGLAKVLDYHLDFGNGHKIAEVLVYVGKINPDGCWISYLWTRPGTTDKVEKITFTKKCKAENSDRFYMVAAGVYAPFSLIPKLNPALCKDAGTIKSISEVK